MNDKLAGMMSRVQKLIAKADDVEARGRSASGVVNDQENTNEASAYRAMAEKIMREYRIAEEDLIATDVDAVRVEIRSMFICHSSSEFMNEYQSMIYGLADHTGVEMVTRSNKCDESYGYWVDMFGYDGDLRLMEWLYSSARLVFGSHLEPQVDATLSDQVNAYNLRQSGMKRKSVALKLWGENTPGLRTKAQRLYVAECKARDEEPALSGLSTDADTFRDAYAQGFVSRLYTMLRTARDAVDSVGGALVFAGREERIKEAMYAAYPYLRPRPREDRVMPTTTEVVPGKKVRERKWTQADERAFQRRHGAAAQMGARAGTAAASKVTIDRTFTPAQRIEGN